MGASLESDVRSVGRRIAVKRMDAGLSQEKFSEMIGMSKTGLGKIESGMSNPKADTLISVCRELHVSPNEIFPEDLSVPKEADPEMTKMLAQVGELTTAQKKQFYSMMRVVLSGIRHPAF